MSPGKLAGQALLWTIREIVVSAALLFIPAWTIHHRRAWVFIAVCVVSTNAIGIYVAHSAPALLQRRRGAGPAKEPRLRGAVHSNVFVPQRVSARWITTFSREC